MKRRSLILILSLICAVFVIGLFAALSYKKSLSHYAISSYLKARGIEMDFSVEHFSLDDITLTDIVLEKKILVPRLHVEMKKGLGFPSRIDVDIKTLDVEAAQLLAKKFSGDSSKSMDFASLQSTCKMLEELDLSAQVQNIQWRESAQRVHFELKHAPQKAHWQGQSDLGDLTITCSPQLLTVSSKKFLVDGDVLTWTGLPAVERAQLRFTQAQFIVSPQNTVQIHLPVSGEFVGTVNDKKINFAFGHATIAGTPSLTDLSLGPFSVEGQKWRLRSPQDLSIHKIDLLFKKTDTAQSLEYSLSGFDFFTSEKLELVHGLSSTGSCQLTEPNYRCVSSISDATRTLSFKDVLLRYDTQKSVIQIQLPQKSSAVHVSDKTAQALPPLAKWLRGGHGRFQLQGHLDSTANGWAGDLEVLANKVTLLTEYGEITQLTLRHNLLSFPDLKSSPGRRLSITQMNAGVILKNIDVQYRIVDRHRIEVEHLHLNYDGADVEAKAFSLFPIEKRIENFRSQVKNYELKKLLALGLKDKVSASGTLSGHINVNFEGKVPTLSGKLVADGTGYIQYRFGQLQKPLISPSDSPMDILYGYLYDFEYQTLSVDIQTNEKYKMEMLLSTFGRNPHYLKGKPLKLKMNLEQNLLAAIRSMMLTYDLPNKIKEHLEKADSQ